MLQKGEGKWRGKRKRRNEIENISRMGISGPAIISSEQNIVRGCKKVRGKWNWKLKTFMENWKGAEGIDTWKGFHKGEGK